MAGTDPQIEWRGPERGPEPTTLAVAPEGNLTQPQERSEHHESPGWAAKLGMWLLWLSVGLPVSTLVFLGIPGFLALLGVASLAEGGLDPERLVGPWLSPEPWLALGAVGVAVNHRASHHHRRPPRDVRSGRRVWFILGAVTNLGALILIGLEVAPQTELHPEIHYVGLSSALGWWVLSLAYLSGRFVSAFAAPVERWAVRSQVARGGLITTGPMAVALVAAVVGSNVAHEFVEAELGGTRALTGSTSFSGGEGWSAPTPRRSFNECIEELYGERPTKRPKYAEEVERITKRQRSGVDAHSIAADASISVCLEVEKKEKRMSSDELFAYYHRAVSNELNDVLRKDRRIDFRSCQRTLDPRDPLTPILEDELTHACLREQLCRMEAKDRDVLQPFFLGHKAREIARDLGMPTHKVQNQLKGSKRRFAKRAIEACMN